MSRNGNRNRRVERIAKEEQGSLEQVVEQATVNEPQDGQQVINLEDVAYMVLVGRYKNGEPFFTNVNCNDIFIVDGLLNYGKREVEAVFATARDKKGE